MYHTVQAEQVEDCSPFESLRLHLNDGRMVYAVVHTLKGKTRFTLELLDPNQLEFPEAS